MKRDAASPSTRSRARKKTAALSEAVASETTPAVSPAVSGPARNLDSLEAGVSLTAGVLFLVGALFPRSIKQLLLLGIGGWLTYRGVTGRCDLYAVLGIDTAKGPLLKQLNDKYLASL